MCIRDRILASLVRSIGELTPISGTAAVPAQPELGTQPPLEEDIDEGNEPSNEIEESDDTSSIDDPADE